VSIGNAHAEAVYHLLDGCAEVVAAASQIHVPSASGINALSCLVWRVSSGRQPD
jgi:hypothetical protein